MSAHLIADPTTSATTLDPTAAGWCALSAALTDQAPPIADRDDLVVTIAPGAGHGAPACFLPHHATIEIDGEHLDGVDPSTATPHRTSDRARYATAWGLLTHECAHAKHSTWAQSADAPAGAKDAALLLEESRIERAQIRRRPDDRHWLRAAATALILAETHADDPAHAPTMTRHDAARTAALLLARATAGILTRAETAPVARVVRRVLGTDTLAELRKVWRAAHKVADDNATTMLDLGRRWCEILGADPAVSHQPEPPDDSERPSKPSPLAKAINKTLGKIAAAVAAESAPHDPTTDPADTAKPDDREEAARDIFTRTGGATIAGTRAPTTAERTAARRLARALSTAGVRDRVTVKTSSPLPPGRLSMRGAMAADAQRAAGAAPTAEPFTRTTRRTAPSPPLRLGIACDVSASMYDFAAPVASAAWILAHAARHAHVPATTATVIFGNEVRPITHPGTAPTHVTEFDANDGWEDIVRAIDALDGALGLGRPGAARLLVIVSDGYYLADQRHHAQLRINRLRAAGCAVLWLAPNNDPEPLDGTTVHELTDPTTTAQAIGRAATAALRATG